MTVHLVKLCVGVESVEQLAEWQAGRLERMRGEGLPPRLRHVTRSTPRRAEEVLEGGSIYWVIRGFIRVRQRIVGLEETTNDEGHPACAILLDPQLVRTSLEPFRPFQGWRYLEVARAPYDIAETGDRSTDLLPSGLAEELRSLGLL